MISYKVFATLHELNDFVDNNEVEVISIYEIEVIKDTGLPLPQGGTFTLPETHVRVWYKEKSEK